MHGACPLVRSEAGENVSIADSSVRCDGPHVNYPEARPKWYVPCDSRTADVYVGPNEIIDADL